jgi:hypothetical protein
LLPGQAPPPAVAGFVSAQCAACHNPKVRQGNLDLTSLPFDFQDPDNVARWLKIHDRVRDGEMPPFKSKSLTASVREEFLKAVSAPLAALDARRAAAQGRSAWRRMNRYEYENTLRDLLGAPWLQIREMLPEDGEIAHFNKVGDALDVSHIQVSQYMAASDYALREVLPATQHKPAVQTSRYYAREQTTFITKMRKPFNERNGYPVVGDVADIGALKGTAPMTVGAANAAVREQEGVGLVCSAYEPVEPRFNGFTAPVSGRYKVRLKAHTMWVGAMAGPKWWKPDAENISKGRTDEPVTLYSETPPRQMRRLGSVDFHPDPSVAELDVILLKGESVRPDATRFFRSRPPGDWRNPLATPEGQPGIVYQWLEVEGPLVDEWPSKGQRLLFGDLPWRVGSGGVAEFQPENPAADSRRLISAFLARAYRRPVPAGETERFAQLAARAMAKGFSFTDALISAYSAILCSPAFTTLEEKPGPLDSYAVASRLSYFLWNTEPDESLRKLAAAGRLRTPNELRAQTRRMLTDPKSLRFVSAFLDYWLDLRKLSISSPDASLYGDYYLDDFLVESAGDETRAFFTELLRKNLPARNLVSSDFAMINGRLADHYGIPGVAGAAIRRVALPNDSLRGGLLTQASVLKVTANGTTTSPVLRGVWINERLLGRSVPPPPAGTPAVEPDTRGATTIREQLAKHRSQTVCNSCHARIDPPGFALESFDVAGGYRQQYRALGEGEKAPGIGKGGHFFDFHYGPPVDASGVLEDGRRFADFREYRRLLLADERQIARNLASQLVTYATGAPVRFGDRTQIEAILDRTKPSQYGVASMVEAIVQSDLFLSK